MKALPLLQSLSHLYQKPPFLIHPKNLAFRVCCRFSQFLGNIGHMALAWGDD